ncbi:MAG: hypothetical protein IKC10_03340 [Alphaproteobacteria bacterium]|nr:hypothetical protein [Alphaproteobacteria bacterium]
MANMEERLQAVVSKAETDGEKWHTIVHGDEDTTVPTDRGNVPTVAKQLKDIREAITGGVSDVVAEAEAARNEAIAAKNATNQLKTQTNTIKTETAQLKTDTLAIKNQALDVFNNISTSTDTAISNIQTEASSQISSIKNTGTTQISTINSTATSQISSINSTGTTQVNRVKTEANDQIALATEQANLSKYYAEACAPTPLGSKLTVPGNSKVPDGYEPVWYKNTITRARYPDFFEQLVDTNSLVLVTEDTYDSQVSTYGMCASYVKVDANTLILPLLVNFGRGGNLDQLGTVQNDQFQGHYHIAQIRQDVYGSGDGATIGTTNGTDEGMRQDGPDLAILNPKTGANGTARFGDETRPKAYYELTYIKCADISRPLTSEETSEIRTTLSQKVNTNLSNFPSNIDYCIENYVASNGNWYRIYKSGRLEQGGFFGGGTSAWASVAITYLKPFQDNTYQLFCLGNWSDAGSSSCKVTAKSTTGATITYANNLSSVQLSTWRATGRK